VLKRRAVYRNYIQATMVTNKVQNSQYRTEDKKLNLGKQNEISKSTKRRHNKAICPKRSSTTYFQSESTKSSLYVRMKLRVSNNNASTTTKKSIKFYIFSI